MRTLAFIAAFALLGLLSVRVCAEEPERLDLRLPEITTVLTQEEIAEVIANTRDPDIIEEVEVEGLRRLEEVPSTPVIRSPWVAPAILAPFWALVNPTQAWRIFAPYPPDQARYIGNTPPDATDSHRPVEIPL